MTIRLMILALLIVFALPVAAETKPSITILSPNGGESFEVKSNKKLTVTWEAVNVPAKAKVCVGVVLEDHAKTYRNPLMTDLSLVNTFDCVTAKNGKGKASEKMLEVYNDIHSTPGEYAIVGVLITESSSGIITQLARDVSNSSFTIKPFTDKKAGMVTVYEGDESWEAGVMLKKDAIKMCQNSGLVNDTKVVRCVWKGKEIYNNTPKDGRKLWVFAYDATRSIAQKQVSTFAAAKKFCAANVARYGSVVSCTWGNATIKKSGETINLGKNKKTEKKKTTEPASTAESIAKEAIEDAEQEVEEVEEEFEQAGSPSSLAADIAELRFQLGEAKRYFAQGNWSAAKSWALLAEEEAHRIGSQF